MENDNFDFSIYDGGSGEAEMIANHTDVINGTKISTPRNQIFVELQTNGKINASIRVNAKVIKRKHDNIYNYILVQLKKSFKSLRLPFFVYIRRQMPILA